LKLLLDTHFLVWWPKGSSRLGSKALKLIADEATELYVSAASWWELAIKRALGRVELSFPETSRALAERGAHMLPMTMSHAEAVATLPAIHSDPFDRMLIAQASVEGLVLLTRDRHLKSYGESVLYV
jgi:PIN domain nuclease of toxin-antitoxin system